MLRASYSRSWLEKGGGVGGVRSGIIIVVVAGESEGDLECSEVESQSAMAGPGPAWPAREAHRPQSPSMPPPTPPRPPRNRKPARARPRLLRARPPA